MLQMRQREDNFAPEIEKMNKVVCTFHFHFLIKFLLSDSLLISVVHKNDNISFHSNLPRYALKLHIRVFSGVLLSDENRSKS